MGTHSLAAGFDLKVCIILAGGVMTISVCFLIENFVRCLVCFRVDTLSPPSPQPVSHWKSFNCGVKYLMS